MKFRGNGQFENVRRQVLLHAHCSHFERIWESYEAARDNLWYPLALDEIPMNETPSLSFGAAAWALPVSRRVTPIFLRQLLVNVIKHFGLRCRISECHSQHDYRFGTIDAANIRLLNLWRLRSRQKALDPGLLEGCLSTSSAAAQADGLGTGQPRYNTDFQGDRCRYFGVGFWKHLMSSHFFLSLIFVLEVLLRRLLSCYYTFETRLLESHVIIEVVSQSRDAIPLHAVYQMSWQSRRHTSCGEKNYS